MTIALAFIITLAISMPIAFALGITGLLGLLMTMGTSLLMLVPQQIFSGMNSFVLMAIPLFLLSGAMFGTNDVAVVAFATERGSASASGAVLACWGAGSMIAALVYGSRPWPWPL